MNRALNAIVFLSPFIPLPGLLGWKERGLCGRRPQPNKALRAILKVSYDESFLQYKHQDARFFKIGRIATSLFVIMRPFLLQVYNQSLLEQGQILSTVPQVQSVGHTTQE